MCRTHTKFSYHSITEGNEIFSCNLGIVPYRFAQVISKYVEGDRVGIFLLINGDIVIAKNKTIYFIKRNNIWLNFKSNSFKNVMNEFVPKIDETLLNEIFATVMDVSLSHTGGIIAVVKKSVSNIVSCIDVITKYDEDDSTAYNKMYYEVLSTLTHKLKQSSKYYNTKIYKIQKDLSKRMLKRQIIHKLISDESGIHKNFKKIDRKLRAELTGLDGACILDYDGTVVSFGAIIKNEAGSSGGGRGAAAKQLSRKGGFAIKISTDGYIEVYVDGNNVYSIK